jgi:hypothetical protein
MPRPALEPNYAYEHAHLIARDLLDDLRRQLDEMVKPDSESVRWRHARTMNQVNARLSDVAELVDQLNVRNR